MKGMIFWFTTLRITLGINIGLMNSRSSTQIPTLQIKDSQNPSKSPDLTPKPKKWSAPPLAPTKNPQKPKKSQIPIQSHPLAKNIETP
jgi:hypothetical protein